MLPSNASPRFGVAIAGRPCHRCTRTASIIPLTLLLLSLLLSAALTPAAAAAAAGTGTSTTAAATTARRPTVNDLLNAARTVLPSILPSRRRPLHNVDADDADDANAYDTAVEARQTFQIDRNGVQFAFGAEHLAGLIRAFMWQASMFILLQSISFPILIHTYKEIFCSWQTSDCNNRYKIPKFEPEQELVFVVDKKKTMKLNKKNQLAGQRPPFKLDDGYEKLDIFPPIGDVPEPPLDLSPDPTTTTTPAPGASRRSDDDNGGDDDDDAWRDD